MKETPYIVSRFIYTLQQFNLCEELDKDQLEGIVNRAEYLRMKTIPYEQAFKEIFG